MTITYSDHVNGLSVRIIADYTPASSEPSEASIRKVFFMGGDIKPFMWVHQPKELARLRHECLYRCEETLDDMRTDQVNYRIKESRER